MCPTCKSVGNVTLGLKKNVFPHQTNFWRKASQVLNSPELRYRSDSSSVLKLVIKFQISIIPLNSSQVLPSDLGFIQILWGGMPKCLSVCHILGWTPWDPTMKHPSSAMVLKPPHCLLMHLFCGTWGNVQHKGECWQERVTVTNSDCCHWPWHWGSVGDFAVPCLISIARLEARWY